MWSPGRRNLFFIGFLICIVGALPFLKGIEMLAPYMAKIPTEGLIYQLIIIALGLIAILLGKPVRTILKE